MLAAATGATLAELMARLGHSTPQAAMRYQHAAQGRDREIAALLSQTRRLELINDADETPPSTDRCHRAIAATHGHELLSISSAAGASRFNRHRAAAEPAATPATQTNRCGPACGTEMNFTTLPAAVP